MDSLQVQTSHRTTLSGLPTSRSRPIVILSREGQPLSAEVSQKYSLEMDNIQVQKSHRSFSLEMNNLKVQTSHRHTLSR
ncbi:hypothetical protein DPMN_187776 [Dreissena polymorpha]|uniref:Uncharacterized protein n=1 Tax=Dreissena polymorpha TaxID=45954 RepID=A0A9D4I9C7_DREPO|nr:hypothetical protein DPMN_187776 [Dreissena polymorpha]